MIRGGGCVTLGGCARPLGWLHDPWGGCGSPEWDSRPHGGDSQPQGPPPFPPAPDPPEISTGMEMQRLSSGGAGASRAPAFSGSTAGRDGRERPPAAAWGGRGGWGGSVRPIRAPTQLRLPFPALFGGAEPPLAVAHGAGAGGVAGLREEAQRLHLLQGGRVSSTRTRERPPFLGGSTEKKTFSRRLPPHTLTWLKSSLVRPK